MTDDHDQLQEIPEMDRPSHGAVSLKLVLESRIVHPMYIYLTYSRPFSLAKNWVYEHYWS